MFITFEGPEGAGKSTQIKLLSNYLHDQNINHIITREPGGTQLAEQLRTIVKHCDYESIHYKTEVLLFAAARSQHYYNVIKPNLDNGIVVLCDRFIDSTYVYQGYGRKIDLNQLIFINQFILQNNQPDLTILINIPVAETMKRVINRDNLNQKTDRFENVNVEFFNSIYDGFNELADLYSHRIVKFDGLKTIVGLSEDIIDCVNKKMKRF